MVDIIRSEISKKPTAPKIKPIPILEGLPASMGFAKGKVRVLNNPKELSELKPGEILVTPTTDPNYVTGIKIASAIITDTGGITCHAAIVAREFNKPCIVGTGEATKKLKTGDTVIVDAGTGRIYKI